MKTTSRFSKWLPLIALALPVLISLGCELPDDPNAAENPPPVEEKVKARATTPYGKAMEAATDLRDKKVPEYNKRLEALADPFAK